MHTMHDTQPFEPSEIHAWWMKVISKFSLNCCFHIVSLFITQVLSRKWAWFLRRSLTNSCATNSSGLGRIYGVLDLLFASWLFFLLVQKLVLELELE